MAAQPREPRGRDVIVSASGAGEWVDPRARHGSAWWKEHMTLELMARVREARRRLGLVTGMYDEETK